MYSEGWDQDDGEGAAADPTFEDLSIDDSLSEIDKVAQYYCSPYPLQRLIYVRSIGEVAHTVSQHEVTEKIMPILESIMQDDEPVVRQALADQYPALARRLLGLKMPPEGDEDESMVEEELEEGQVEAAAYDVIVQTVLPHLSELLVDTVPQVRANASTSLIRVARLLPPSLRHQHLHQLLVALSEETEEDEHREEHRCSVAQLINDMAALIGKDLCLNFAVPLLVELAGNPSFRVRKAVAQHLGHVCEMIGPDHTVDQMIPMWRSLAGDDIWGVRKACAESMVAMSKALRPETRGEVMVGQFVSFSKDVSRWVRSAAFQHLGPLIATLRGADVTDELIGYFTEMSNPRNSASTDGEVSSFCAFNFPAVVLTVGPERWGSLKEAFTNLCHDVQWKVRRCISHSIHEVARIIGPDLTHSDLVEPFSAFMIDLDEVKEGAVKTLAGFLACVPEESLPLFLETIQAIQQERDNWRFRKALAKQLARLGDIYDAEAVRTVLLPTALLLCRDKFARVRTYAHHPVGPLIAKLAAAGVDTGPYVADINDLLNTETGNFQSRQMYLWIMQSGYKFFSKGLFEQEFMGHVIAMATDKVANVRIALSRLLAEHLMLDDNYRNHEGLNRIINQLTHDKDRDVVYFSKIAAAVPEEGEVEPIPN